MDRDEAVALLKTLYSQCPVLIGKPVALMPPNSRYIPTNGYQIHIYANDEYIHSCVKRVAENHQLTLREENKLLIIYRPMIKRI